MKKLMMMFFAMISVIAFGTEYEWSESTSGTFDWNDSANWGSAGIPNASGDIATLTNGIAGSQTINLNQETTIGSMNIGSPSTAAFTITGPATGSVGGNTLVYTNDSGDTTITGVGTATDIINADVEFGSDTTIDSPFKEIQFNGITTSTNKSFVITDNSEVKFQNGGNNFAGCEFDVGTNVTIYSYRTYEGTDTSSQIYNGDYGTMKYAKLYMGDNSTLSLKDKVDQYDTANTLIDVVAKESADSLSFYSGRLTGGDDPGYIGLSSLTATNVFIEFNGDGRHFLKVLDTYFYGTNSVYTHFTGARGITLFKLSGSGELHIVNGGDLKFASGGSAVEPYTGVIHVDDGTIEISARSDSAPFGYGDVVLGIPNGGASGDIANIMFYNSEWNSKIPNDIYVAEGFAGSVKLGGENGGGGSFIGTITASNDFKMVSCSGRSISFSGAIKGKGDITADVDYGGNYSGSSIVSAGSTTNTYDGTLSIDRGRFIITKSDGITAIPGDVIVGNGAGTVGQEDLLEQRSAEVIADTSTMTVNSYGKYDVNGETETISNLWVNGSGLVVTSGGRLALGTDSGSGTGVIVNGGTLGGNGYISETIDVLDGKIVPGYEDMGTLAASNTVSLGSDAVCSFYISPSNNTMLVTADALTLGGTVEVTADPSFKPISGTYYGVIKTDGTVSGSFESINAGTINGVSMKVSYTGNITDTEVLPTGGDDIVLYAMAGGTLFIIQ